jgi:hypothetical protein
MYPTFFVDVNMFYKSAYQVLVFYLGLKRGMVYIFFKGHLVRRIYQKGHIEKIG